MIVICLFDITDNRIRRQVNKQLEGYGYRIQDSVYLCDVTSRQFRKLQRCLLPLIEDTDRIHYYPLCGKDVGQSESMGAASPLSFPTYYHI